MMKTVAGTAPRRAQITEAFRFVDVDPGFESGRKAYPLFAREAAADLLTVLVRGRCGYMFPNVQIVHLWTCYQGWPGLIDRWRMAFPEKAIVIGYDGPVFGPLAVPDKYGTAGAPGQRETGDYLAANFDIALWDLLGGGTQTMPPWFRDWAPRPAYMGPPARSLSGLLVDLFRGKQVF